MYAWQVVCVAVYLRQRYADPVGSVEYHDCRTLVSPLLPPVTRIRTCRTPAYPARTASPSPSAAESSSSSSVTSHPPNSRSRFAWLSVRSWGWLGQSFSFSGNVRLFGSYIAGQWLMVGVDQKDYWRFVATGFFIGSMGTFVDEREELVLIIL